MENRQIGPYKILEELGQGGMGVVYLADDTRLGRQVAIKALPPRLSRDPSLRERLRREARAAAMLSHPGIATVHALEEFDDELFMVSEYVRGHSLRLEIERGALPPGKLVETSLEIARALSAAHVKGVVHRDLKPENVMRSADSSSVKVLDFGLAHVEPELGCSTGVVSRLTGDGKIVGTAAYMSPEQLLGADVDFRTDIFSFGVMLYELATGVHPFEGSDLPSTISRILQVDPTAPSELSSSGRPEIDAIVGKCLRKQPDQRYRSTAALVRDLEQLQQRLAPQPAAARHRPSTPVRQNRSPGGLWWWQLHQLTAAFSYGLMVYPLWKVRGWLAPQWGLVLSLAVLVPMVVVSGLRVHLWFTASYYPGHLSAQLARVSGWVRAGDIAFVLALLATGATAAVDHPGYTTIMVLFAVGATLAFLVVEPATARAVFRRSSSRSGSRKPARSGSGTQKPA